MPSPGVGSSSFDHWIDFPCYGDEVQLIGSPKAPCRHTVYETTGDSVSVGCSAQWMIHRNMGTGRGPEMCIMSIYADTYKGSG